jgi:predicted dehydrogenase/nucleoside-diphosphate-sugar epimerase
MKIAMLGAGHIARLHAPAIRRQPDVQIVAIGDHDLTRARALARDLGVADVFGEPAAALEHTKPDVVHVLAPPHDHARLSLMAMHHGCHVYVEKPMALTPTEADDMIAVARQQRVCLCVGHNMLFDPTVDRAVQLVAHGAVGDTVSVEASYLFDPRRYSAILQEGAEHCHWSYRLNGGPLQDLLPHMGSLVCKFVPALEEVHAITRNRGVLPSGWPDEIRVLVGSKTVLGILAISLSERPDTISLVVKGTEGTLNVDLFKNVLRLERRSHLPRAIARGLSGFSAGGQYVKQAFGNVVQVGLGRMDKSSGLTSLVSRFYAAIREGTPPPVSLEESRRVVELMTRIWPTPTAPTPAGAAFVAPPRRPHRTVALVTGATGFIGSRLVTRLIAEGIGVRALVRRNSIHAGRLVGMDAHVVEGDLADSDVLLAATQGVQRVFHVAAPMSGGWAEHRAVTIAGTERLLDAALSAGVERFVHVSTLAVYDLATAKPGALVSEDWPYQARVGQMGAYAHAKIEAEKLVLDAYRRGLPATIVRPGIVIGPRGRVFFPHLGYRVGDRVFLVPGHADVVLPLTYVDNTVDGMYRASIAPDATGHAYNLVDEGGVTVGGYLQAFISMTGVEARVINLPYALPYIATAGYEMAAGAGLLPRGITSRAQLRWKGARVRFDTTKARTELGWTPIVSIREALAMTFKWYVDHPLAR